MLNRTHTDPPPPAVSCLSRCVDVASFLTIAASKIFPPRNRNKPVNCNAKQGFTVFHAGFTLSDAPSQLTVTPQNAEASPSRYPSRALARVDAVPSSRDRHKGFASFFASRRLATAGTHCPYDAARSALAIPARRLIIDYSYIGAVS